MSNIYSFGSKSFFCVGGLDSSPLVKFSYSGPLVNLFSWLKFCASHGSLS